MNSSWHDSETTKSVLQAAGEMNAQGVESLIWLASQLVGAATAGECESSEEIAVLALAACQQSLVLCRSELDVSVPPMAQSVSSAQTARAHAAVADGAREIAALGPDGIRILVENVLPQIHRAVEQFSGETRVHEITTWFLLALSVGPHDRGPESDIYSGILLSYPMPEPQMLWA